MYEENLTDGETYFFIFQHIALANINILEQRCWNGIILVLWSSTSRSSKYCPVSAKTSSLVLKFFMTRNSFSAGNKSQGARSTE